jgi:hypothetical protein
MMDLYTGKGHLIKKYGLFLDNGYWYIDKENSYRQLVFKDSFFQKSDLVIILFRIYKLCFAKVNYFRRNIQKYEAYKYHYKEGFIKSELWDADFFRHKKSGYIIDLRFLQTITDITLFLELVTELELMEDELERDIQIVSRLKLIKLNGNNDE